MKVGEDLPKHIERFLDDDLPHMFENERYRPTGLEKELNSDNFKKMIIDDDSID